MDLQGQSEENSYGVDGDCLSGEVLVELKMAEKLKANKIGEGGDWESSVTMEDVLCPGDVCEGGLKKVDFGASNKGGDDLGDEIAAD